MDEKFEGYGYKHIDGREQKEDPSEPAGIIALANVLPDMGALSVLNLADNNLGELVLPGGWTHDYKADYSAKEYNHTDGRKQDLHPGKPEGIIALGAVIPGMGAMTSLNLASNKLGVEGAKIIAACLPKCT
jgi:hypothetical protein